MSNHSKLSPSSASRWIACAGSVRLCVQYPSETSNEADEGTAAHWAAAELLNGSPVCIGQVAENGVTLNEEMIDAAHMYVGAIGSESVHVEEKIDIASIHARCFGTPDAWRYDGNTNTLHIYDFKYGHRHVEVFENWQLITYAAGILEALGVTGDTDQHLNVVFVIVQPRSYHSDGPVRTWQCKASYLRPHFNKLRYAADLAMRSDAKLTTNPECRDCSARHACPALQKFAYVAADQSTQSAPLELNATALGLELHMLERAKTMLDARISGLQEQTLARVKKGESVPFYRTEPSTGRSTWSKPFNEVVVLGKMFGVDVAKQALITPAQATKAGIPEAVVTSYCAATVRGVKLVSDDGSHARKIFSQSY